MTTLTIKKSEQQEELRIVWAEVYAPDRPDSGGDFMTKEEIRKMAHRFMKKMALGNVDVMHDNRQVEGVQIVESFVARDDDPVFIPGSWVVGVHIPDDNLWQRVKKGEINGFSLEAVALTENVEVEIDFPPVVSGNTDKAEDHVHKFYVTYDDQGNFLGGKTDEVSGHSHVIKAGTVTELENGHTHRFSSVDNLRVVG